MPDHPRALAANDDPHISGAFRCIACKHEWLAVAPLSAEGFGDAECPACGCFRGQPKYPIGHRLDDEVWQCGNCEGILFMITRPGTFCIGCGRQAAF